MPQIMFPSLPDGLDTRLAAIQIAAAGSPGFFDSPECPYSDLLKGFLRRMMAPTGPSSVDSSRSFDTKGDEDKLDLLLREIELTIEEMGAIERTLGGADAGDRIAFIKAKTSLLEKWISLKEKVFSIREIAEFQQIVVRFLEDVLTKDQRAAFIDSMRGLRTMTGKLV